MACSGPKRNALAAPWIGKQVQDVLDQRVHDQLPSTWMKLFAGRTGVLRSTVWIPLLLRIGAESPS